VNRSWARFFHGRRDREVGTPACAIQIVDQPIERLAGRDISKCR
jgi:hypothetical protein